MIGLGLEVEAFREIMGNFSLGCRVRVGQRCRDRESGISVILLMVDLRVVGILGVDVVRPEKFQFLEKGKIVISIT